MTETEKINQLESEVVELKTKVDFLINRLGLTPDREKLQRAIELMMTTRDTSAFENYLALGGKISQDGRTM
jgi:hypothetical protein